MSAARSPVLVAAATVLDTLPHVQRFVAGNLAGGIDHLVVFLDKPAGPGQAEVRSFLEEHPHVTCVPAGAGWWGERPHLLNVRQCTNANLVKELLGGVGEAGHDAWVFHVDGDEVVRVDRTLLAGADGDVVRLTTREAVARERWEGEPTLFKRLLEDDDLVLLQALGVLDEPDNRDYFHGHLQGKGGVRASGSAWLTLHRPVDRDGRVVPPLEDDRLELFHYESYSGEEFVRKWTAMVASGPRASHRPGRTETAAALRTLLAKRLPEEALRRHLMEIFRRTTLDRDDVLSELGLLVETDPLAAGHRPEPLPEPLASALADGLERWRGQPKDAFFHGVRPAAEDGAVPAGGGRGWRRRSARRPAGG